MRHLCKGSSRTAAAGEKRWETSPSTRMRLVTRWTRRRLKCAVEDFAASHRRSHDDGSKLSAKDAPTFHLYPHVNNFVIENKKPRKKVQELLCFHSVLVGGMNEAHCLFTLTFNKIKDHKTIINEYWSSIWMLECWSWMDDFHLPRAFPLQVILRGSRFAEFCDPAFLARFDLLLLERIRAACDGDCQTCDASSDAKPRNRTNPAPETARELADDAYAFDHALSASSLWQQGGAVAASVRRFVPVHGQGGGRGCLRAFW